VSATLPNRTTPKVNALVSTEPLILQSASEPLVLGGHRLGEEVADCAHGHNESEYGLNDVHAESTLGALQHTAHQSLYVGVGLGTGHLKCCAEATEVRK
jgi:hypothetical protein